MSENLIEVKDLSVSFFTKQGEVKAVDKVSYNIRKGRIMGIVGESGCGKSVTSFTIMGLLAHPGKIVNGQILFQGDDIAKYSEADYQALRGNKIAMIFQEPMTALNPVLTVGFQITEQVLKHRKISKEEADRRAVELLDLVGIPSPEQRVNEYPHQLSGGMKQRAMIAMALSCDPDFLIADEPTTALDVTIQAQILELIQELQEKLNMTVQFITHDLGVISEIADDVIVMYAGKVVESGPSEEIFARPAHPYTQGLLASIPKLGDVKEKLYTIAGNVPSPMDLPSGCAFYNRCPYAKDDCLTNRPELKTIKGNQKIACFYPNLENKEL